MNEPDSHTPDHPDIQKTGEHFSHEKEARGFDAIASTVFSPIYPVIAEQILERTGKRGGIAMDLGCGPGHLAVAVATQSDLRVFALDSSPMMLKIALEHIFTSNLVRKVVPVLGDVHSIPFEDETIDIVFSRGSWFFWEDLSQAFWEIYRVLTPGGIAYIGGGFGNSHLKKKIFNAMKEKDSDFEKGVQKRLEKNSPELIRREIEKTPVRSYDLIHDESGFWVIIKK